MKTTKRLLSLLAMVAVVLSCSTTDPNKEPVEPPIVDGKETKYPKDEKPEQFTNFFKRTMIVDHTGTGCGYCPRIVASLNKIEESDDHDKIVVVASHTYNSNDPMYNDYAKKYRSYCGVNSYPTVNLDLRKTSDATFTNASASEILKKCNALETKYPAKVAIATAVEIENDEFVVHVGVKTAAPGSYNIGFIVLEDGVSAKQANNGYTGYNFNIHNHAVRGGSPSSVTGEPLEEGLIDAGRLIEKTFRVPLPDKTKLENAKIVVYVSCPDTEGGRYYINNVVVCKPGSSVPFKYNE